MADAEGAGRRAAGAADKAVEPAARPSFAGRHSRSWHTKQIVRAEDGVPLVAPAALWATGGYKSRLQMPEHSAPLLLLPSTSNSPVDQDEVEEGPVAAAAVEGCRPPCLQMGSCS